MTNKHKIFFSSHHINLLLLFLQDGDLVQDVHLPLEPGQAQPWGLVEEVRPAVADPDCVLRIPSDALRPIQDISDVIVIIISSLVIVIGVCLMREGFFGLLIVHQLHLYLLGRLSWLGLDLVFVSWLGGRSKIHAKKLPVQVSSAVECERQG